MSENWLSYFRPNTLPHMWCPGCGNGIAVQAMLRAIDKLQLDRDKVVVVGGIGCSSRAVSYLDFHTLHTTHGRAVAFATGIKMAKPDLTVFVIMGDGDASAIGGNHLIHAARRNIDLNLLVFNNSIYGMTGGQVSPLTPGGSKTTTSPYGAIDPPFDLAQLMKGAGATFIARSTTYHARLLSELIVRAVQHRGLSFVEAVTHCPTSFGRRNKMPEPVQMLEWQKQSGVPKEKYERLAPEEKVGKYPIGLLHVAQAPEYCETYAALLKERQQKPR